MPRNGLLIDYHYCTGCYACEVACKQEHNYPAGTVGIKVNEMVTETGDDVKVDFMPVLTRHCDLCAERTKVGDVPACVKHCQARCMTYGPVTELAKTMESQPKTLLYAPK